MEKNFFVAFAENGDFITEVETIEDGIKFIKELEQEDKTNGCFAEYTYEIENKEHEAVYNEKYSIDIREK